jgi:hypothetical protein
MGFYYMGSLNSNQNAFGTGKHFWFRFGLGLCAPARSGLLVLIPPLCCLTDGGPPIAIHSRIVCSEKLGRRKSN